MLVVNLHTLKTIDFLNLVHEIGCQCFNTHDFQNVMRHRITIDQRIALTDIVAFLNGKMLALRDHVIHRFRTVILGRHNSDTPFRLVVLAEFNPTLVVRDDRMILRLAGFKQFSNPRQTTGDITCLRAFPGNTCQHVTGSNRLTRFHRQNGVEAHKVAGFDTVRQGQHFTILVTKRNPRLQVVALRLLLPVDDHLVGNARRFVEDFAIGHAFDHVDEVNDTFLLRHDREGVRIPLGQLVTTGDLLAILDQQLRTIRQTMPGALASLIVLQDHFGITPHDHRNAAGVIDGIIIEHAQHTIMACFNMRLFCTTLGSTTDMEGTHRELCTRLTNGLSGNNTDSFTDVDRRTTCQIAAIAGPADTADAFTGQHGADLEIFDIRIFHDLDIVFLDQLALGNQNFAGHRMQDVERRRATENTIFERGYRFATFNHGSNGQTVDGTAIFLDNDGVLRHIDKTTCQITGVSCLQSRIGQTLTGTMGRVEVLEHGQAFLEV